MGTEMPAGELAAEQAVGASPNEIPSRPTEPSRPNSSRKVSKNIGNRSDTASALTADSSFPSKTDKPKPHVCETCTRPFARLEHLKRHERSHTHERPFTCQHCNRQFSRRDLLLRHQQKLHADSTPPARPRAARRESLLSTASAGSGKVAKRPPVGRRAFANRHVVVNRPETTRPRANTVGHVDCVPFSPFTASNLTAAQRRTFSVTQARPQDIDQWRYFANPDVEDYCVRANMHASLSRQPPSLAPLHIPHQPLAGHLLQTLHSAPAHGQVPPEYAIDGYRDLQGHTVNPAQLHLPFGRNPSPLQPGFSSNCNALDEEAGFDFLNETDHLFKMEDNEQAIESSSPSAMSCDSQATGRSSRLGMVHGPSRDNSDDLALGSHEAALIAAPECIWQPDCPLPPMLTDRPADMSGLGLEYRTPTLHPFQPPQAFRAPDLSTMPAPSFLPLI